MNNHRVYAYKITKIPPHLNNVAALPCYSLAITRLGLMAAVFLTWMFHKVVQRRVWGVVGHLMTPLLRIYCWLCW